MLQSRRPVGHVEGADVGSGGDDAVDRVENLIGQNHVGPREEIVELFHGAWSNQRGGDAGKWIHRYTEFIATKRGLAAALHSGDPAFEELPAYFMSRFGPTLQGLLNAASAAGEIRDDVDAEYLLHTVANLAMPLRDEGAAYSQKMIMIVIDGLRFGAPSRVA